MDHFTKRQDGKYLCNHCPTSYSSLTSTTNLTGHLEAKNANLLKTDPERELTTDEVHTYLMLFIISNALPISIVDCPFLEILIKNRPLLYSKIGRKGMKNKIKNFKDQVQNTIKEECKSIEDFTIVSDGWSSKQPAGYMNDSIIYLNENMELRNPTIGFEHFTEKHSGQNLAAHTEANLTAVGLDKSQASGYLITQLI